MTSDSEELVLQELYFRLIDRGFSLGVRDYLDALRSLRAGFGHLGRERLLWLCQTLWARSDDERRLIDVLFEEVPQPDPEEIAELSGTTPPPIEFEQPTGGREPAQTVAHAGGSADEEVAVDFVPASEAGLGIPRASVGLSGRESFVLSERPVVPERNLTIVWRRFRRSLRSGPPVELDIDATLARKCEQGFLHEPVLVPARRNQARLIVLVDASASMVAWKSFFPVLQSSLRMSQLGSWKLWFFHNEPEEELYDNDYFQRPISLERALSVTPEAPLLIISDAGAARGFRSRERADRTQAFAARVRDRWAPIVWANPMPRPRWSGSTAAEIANLSAVTMVELNEEGLIRAIDVFRGRRTG